MKSFNLILNLILTLALPNLTYAQETTGSRDQALLKTIAGDIDKGLNTSYFKDRILSRTSENKDAHSKRKQLPSKQSKSDVDSKKVKPSDPISVNQGKQGKSIIEQQKAAVRAKLAKKRSQEASAKAAKDSNQSMPNNLTDELIDEHRSTIQSWVAEYQAELKSWAKQRDLFLKNINLYMKYGEDTTAIDEQVSRAVQQQEFKKYEEPVSKKATATPVPSPITELNPELKPAQKKLDTKIEQQTGAGYFLEAASQITVKNQFARPTCSSFAAIRGIEIKLAQQGEYHDLSEQYFYWASKPNCRQSPCAERGSWAGYALELMDRQANHRIPFEKDCPYVESSKKGNETQIPLSNSCNAGKAWVSKFRIFKSKQILREKLKQDHPVLIGVTLTKDFSTADGFLGLSNSKLQSNTPGSLGHAVLAVGELELPPEKWDREGKYCILIANSWGTGWGRGGHSCVSEKWLNVFGRKNPYISFEEVRI